LCSFGALYGGGFAIFPFRVNMFRNLDRCSWEGLGLEGGSLVCCLYM
jgi:hypothetical protein